jgi:hypothetical protein
VLLLADVKSDDKIYKNKNGYFTEEEMLEFKNMSDEDFINYLRPFKITTHKCPQKKYQLHECFNCINCMKEARNVFVEKKVK